MDPNATLAYTFLSHLVSTVSPALPGLLFLPTAWKDFFHQPPATLTPQPAVHAELLPE